ncbi:MAG: ABC transporter permease [Lachnoclostridium sp.]|nr:ABC transporter permease [Lachnoclostridium sp.]
MIRVAWNYLKGYKKNTLVCMIGIALSVLLMFSLVQMGGTIIAQYKDAMSGCAPYDMKIPALDLEEMDEIYDMIGVQKSKEIWYANTFVDKSNTDGCVVGVEGDWEETWGLRLIEGEEPQNAYEICVDEKFCKELEVSCGDELPLVLQDADGAEFPASFQIVGVLDTVPTPFAIYYIFTDIDTAENVIAQEGYAYNQDANFVSILFDEERSGEQASEVMDDLADKYGVKFFSQISHNEGKEELLLEKGAYFGAAGGFYAIVGVIALCMIIFVYNTINISLTERLRQYGTLRCLGISNKGLLGILFMEELFYTAGGLVLGIFFGRLLNGMVADRIIYWIMDIQVEKSVDYPWLYLLVVGITLLAVFLATVVAIWRISRRTPMELLKYMEKLPKRIKRGKGKNLFLEMLNRNLQRNPSKSRILFVTITLVSFLLIALGNVASTLNFSLDKSLFTAADIQIESEFANLEKPYISEEDRLQCEMLKGVEQVHWLVRNPAYDFYYKEQEIPMCLYVYSDSWMEKFLEYNELEELEIQGYLAIVLKKENTQQEEMQAGDYIQLRMEAGDWNYEYFPNIRQNYEIEVSEVLMDSSCSLKPMTSYGDADYDIIVNEALGRKLLGEIGYYDVLFLECEAGMDAHAVRTSLDMWDYVYSDLNNAVEDSEKQLLGIVALCVYLLVAVVILTIFIIQNIVKANFRARLKEIGMLRSIGAEEKMIKHLLCGEIMMNAIKAVVLGGFMATIVSFYFYHMTYSTWGTGLMGYMIGIPVILLGCYLIAAIAVRSSLKISICDLIKNE